MRSGLALLSLAAVALGRGFHVAPFTTWFYVLAWYPVLVLLDDVARRRTGTASWFRPARFLPMAGWSVVIWLAFEAANFRLQNWYYVGLPNTRIERWTGILLSFGTVVPAILLAERVLAAAGLGERWRTRPLRSSPSQEAVARRIGWAMAGAALAWPRHLGPLLWGSLFLVADPFVLRRRPDHSLLADALRGDWRRIGRLLVGGLSIGVLWEALNALGGGRWIYTVPFLEEGKIFEMPLVGFLGFPVFALSVHAAYAALIAARVAPDPRGGRPAPGRTAVAVLAALAFSWWTLRVMDTRTVSSTVPRLRDLAATANLDPTVLTRAGIHTLDDLTRPDARARLQGAGLPDSIADATLDEARLARLRDMGTDHARELATVGIRSVCALARDDPHLVYLDIHGRFRGLGPRPTEAEVRVWHRAAVRACPNPGAS